MTCEMRAREDDDDADKLTPANMFSFFFVLFIVLGCCFYIKRIFSWYLHWVRDLPNGQPVPSAYLPFSLSSSSSHCFDNIHSSYCILSKKRKKGTNPKGSTGSLLCVLSNWDAQFRFSSLFLCVPSSSSPAKRNNSSDDWITDPSFTASPVSREGLLTIAVFVSSRHVHLTTNNVGGKWCPL